MSLFWWIFALNAVVLGTATALLLWAPVTVSVPVLLTEAIILVAGLAVMLVANAALLRLGLAPLDRLAKLMTTVDLLRPGRRLPASGGGEVAEVIRTFNAMLERLEHERATSSAQALLAQEAERRRIAQELHDEVGQSMTAILLGLKRAADDAPAPLRQELHEVQEIPGRAWMRLPEASCDPFRPGEGAVRPRRDRRIPVHCRHRAGPPRTRPARWHADVVLPRRWVVERSWSWIMRARRHCRDHERLPEMSESLITWAAITLMTRRLARRKARPAERRDVAHGYVMPEAA